MAGTLKKKKIIIWTVVIILLFFCVWFRLGHRHPFLNRFHGDTMGGGASSTFDQSGALPDTTNIKNGSTQGAHQTDTVIKKIIVPPVFQYGSQEEPRGNTSVAAVDLENSDSPVEQGKRVTQERKEKAGIDKSLDLIVRTDERFIIGGHTLSMQDILEKSLKKKGMVVEESIGTWGEISTDSVKTYGIYVVRPGDNIWNIHFRILQEYFAGHGVRLVGVEDEPTASGKSSGIGKLLKFSENMVIIYDLVQRGVTENIHLLEPLSKIVVYNMHEIFSLLREIDYDNVERIQFDGNTIWIPADQP